MPRNKESEEPSQSEDLTVRGVPEGQLRPRSPNGALVCPPPPPRGWERGSSSPDYRQYDVLGGWRGRFSLFTQLKAEV